MALEDALLKLAEAINNHAEATKSSARPTTDKVVEKPKKVDPKPADTTKTDTTSDTAPAAEPPADDLAGDDVVDPAALKAEFIKLVNKDRPAAEGILTKLGFTKLNLVPANKHTEAWGLITEALGATNG